MRATHISIELPHKAEKIVVLEWFGKELPRKFNRVPHHKAVVAIAPWYYCVGGRIIHHVIGFGKEWRDDVIPQNIGHNLGHSDVWWYVGTYYNYKDSESWWKSYDASEGSFVESLYIQQLQQEVVQKSGLSLCYVVNARVSYSILDLCYLWKK